MKIEAWKKHSIGGRFQYPQWKNVVFCVEKYSQWKNDKKNIGSLSLSLSRILKVSVSEGVVSVSNGMVSISDDEVSVSVLVSVLDDEAETPSLCSTYIFVGGGNPIAS